MYTISNKTDAIKAVQLYLGLNESGIFDDKTGMAVKEFQSSKKLDITGVVDYTTFVMLRSCFYSRLNAKAATAIAPKIKFPVKPGDNGTQIAELNSKLAEVLERYSFYGIPPRGSFYNRYTSAAVVRLREIFGFDIIDEIDEEMYVRIQRERLTRSRDSE